ncbi:hypothetical protein LTR91_017569 [Friedmanniomyces endolithicus]|uniref:DUF4211 domain-containing protein n=1 Tax=Friedmanniomyces endolithicus TaxID=329885 RepID=A0AAN6K5X5_9PEZI|nr:hypothetical protein LTR57_024057 [Friedmanniomyces endolithicus]KAK0954195.1 hypothetical protein LTS01_024028 [Friedmanniomyces endolithicus]KAK0966459.1 hypothetical protein LTR91_017569 [Friedmanniomyces endolithicus]KAK1051561.1 hypothetical protein LTS16_002432 [Friedmanniomyces endolithicus]
MRPPRRQQTRLTFTPLPSSSPATKGYPQQIQDRAAAVGYSGNSPAKRRKLRATDDAPFGKDGANDLPTPAATMTLGRGEDSVSSDEDEPARSTARLTSRKRSGQQSLDFTGARESSSFSSPVRLHSSPKPQTAGMFGTQTRRSQRQRTVTQVSSGESGEEEVRTRSEVHAKSRKPAGTSRSSQRPVVIDSGDEDSDTTTLSDKPPRLAILEESEDEDAMPTTQGKMPRKRRQRSRGSFVSSSPPRAVESDSDLEIIEKPKIKGRGRQHSVEEDDEDEEDEDTTAATPTRRRLKRPRQMSQREQDDLNEDMNFLGPSSDVDALERQPRSTQDKQKSARLAALEKLKRQRSGQPAVIEEEEEEGSASDGDASDANDDDSDVPVVTSSRNMFKATEDDDAFIASDPDDDDTLGAPDIEMPLAFTRQASSKPKELFKHAVEWFVQRKINPGFNMHDELYELTFQKLDNEVQALTSSKFMSAAWTIPFTAAITARPEIAIEALDRNSDEHWMNDKCDACNRSGHPATFQIQFQGKPYHPQTLEEVGGRDVDDEDDEDTSSSSGGGDNDDQPAQDYRGNKVPPASTIYYVGKFCKANAETAHELQHWRYHLNEYAIVWMTAQGYLTAEKIVKRDQLSTKKRQREAIRITDHMERSGEIRKLWETYRRKIDDARNSKQGRFVAGR